MRVKHRVQSRFLRESREQRPWATSHFSATVFVLAAVVSGCATDRQAVSQDDATAIRAVLSQVIDSYNAQDLEGLAGAYSEDAWHMSIRRPMVKGRENIAAFYGPAMPTFRMESAREELDLEIHGDAAVMIQASTLTGFPRDKPESGPVFEEKRLSTIVFRKMDGRWYIHRYMDSTNPAITGSDGNPGAPE